MTTKAFKSVDEMVDKTASRNAQKVWRSYQTKRRRLVAKHAKDPHHRHVREEIGSAGPVNGSWKVTFFWCKICHAEMPPLRGKLEKVKRRTS